ncbi:BTB/POZ and MATH domain-containing protein 3-like [Lolium rigidum]|uniref:BTB/POZ and MATH domain-containing protein 3-like n=1 Tax=Lolium rigidum TaxID=89674 RepID=UPI001F5C42B6|nr:BTB/POZ and MATH domain-containing protein 3-like [Lolium rigidum]
MAFAGVSVIVGGKLLDGSTTPTFDAGTESGYHLLVVQGHPCTSNPTEDFIIGSHCFTVGGHRWSIYYHHFSKHPVYAFFTSLQLLDDDGAVLSLEANLENPVKVQLDFSFGDETEKQEPARIRANNIVEFGGVNGSMKGHGRFVTREAMLKSTLLVDDCFTIRWDVVVLNPARSTSSSIDVPPSEMKQDFAHFLSTGEGADVVFHVGDETFAAHRCVLAARSSVFKVMLFGPMKEGMSTNIQIDNMDATVFKALLGFIYGDSLPAEMPSGDEDDGVDLLQHLLVVADSYGLKRLSAMCEKKLCEHIGVTTATTMLALAEQHSFHRLKAVCYEFLRCPANMKAVVATDGFDLLCSSCPTVMKDLILGMLQMPKKC